MSTKKYAYVNSNMLSWARSTTPFSSTRDVEEKIKISSKEIDSWEKGESLPSVSEAKKLSKLYKLPFATFYLSEPPEYEPRPYTDRRTVSGTVYGPVSYELWAEIGRIINNRDQLVDLVDEENLYESIPKVDEMADIAEIGSTIRSFLGISLPFKNKSAYDSNSYKYYRKIIESKGILVSQISGVSLNEMKGISIYYDSFPIVAINSKDYDRAKTFSLMHELAHLMRRSSSLCLIDFDERNDMEEKTCDAIAAEVLMPKKEFIAIVNGVYNRYGEYSEECLTSIADRFGVSSFSVIRRLYETDMIDKNTYKLMYDQYTKSFEEKLAEIEFNKEAKENRIPYHYRFLNREGYLYTRIIMDSYAKGSISYGEMCNTLGVKSSYINLMERAVMSL